MSDDNGLTEIPWGWILKRTAQVAAAAGSLVLVTPAGLSRSEVNRNREEKRHQWTDGNRFRRQTALTRAATQSLISGIVTINGRGLAA